MTRPDDTHREAHPEELLPWLANGTLAGEERERVERHLARCPRCREELAFLQRLRDEVKRQAAATPPPGELGLKRLLRDIDAEPPATAPAPRRGAWWQPSLAAAAVVIVIQGALLLNLWQGRDDAGMRLAGEAPAAAVVVQIRFAPDAEEAHIRQLLRDAGARFIDGPSAIGLYRLELQGLTPGDAEALERRLAKLRRATEIVSHVAPE